MSGQIAQPFKSRLFGQEGIFQSIRESFHEIPHIFITGPTGCGKTTFLEDFISLLRKEAPFQIESILWLTSEKDRGIHTIRDKVNDFCKRTHSRQNTLRWIVIDDADTLPLISQQALRRPMETFSHLTRFIFASRHSSHLIEPLRSRCLTMELEPISPFDAYPRFLESFAIPLEAHTDALQTFCIGNFVNTHEIKTILKLYKSLLTQGLTTEESLKHLESLLPTSKIHTHTLIKGLTQKNVHLIHTSITQLFMNGYLLDDILLSLEKNVSLFPSRNPEIRFRILQFIMLGWIFIQQGKEHWLDTMDIVEKVLKNA
jgi:energy-coupling factor transporter ATP-binding protein EcfA2